MVDFKKFLLSSAVVLGIGASAQAQFVPPIEIINDDGEVVQLEAQQYIIKYKDQSKTDMTRKISKMHGTVALNIDESNMVAAVLPIAEAGSLKNDPNVEFIEVDARWYKHAEEVTYGIGVVQADQVSSEFADNQKVCVVDTGYELTHVDLPTNNVTGSDLGGLTGNPWNMDGDGHGSHVAGTIAAIGGNDEGVVGVVSSGTMPLHIYKVFDDNGEWTSASSVITAVNDCVSQGATVINMSLGGPDYSAAANSAMNDAYDAGVLIVSSAGNDGNDRIGFPASYDNVISAAAIGSDEDHASYSQYNHQVELAGPGTLVRSTTPGNSYGFKSGTSMASPHIAGVAALVWSHYPECSNAQIRNTLAATAEDQGDVGRDHFFGYGIVKAKAAVDMLAQGCDTAPDIVQPEPPLPPELENNIAVTGLDALENDGFRYYIDVPAGATNLVIQTSGGTGDADLYVKLGDWPHQGYRDCQSTDPETVETCTFATPAAGRYFIYLYAWATFTNVDIVASYDGGAPVENVPPVNDWNFTCTDLSCDFDGTASSDSDGSITSYFWKFDPDLPGVSGATTSYTFSASGTYRVAMTVTDNDGAKVKLRKNVTVVDPNSSNVPPVNRWWNTCDGLTCNFVANQSSDPDGEIVSYFWKYQAGVKGQFGNPGQYTFPAAGTYRVLLTVKDNEGAKTKKYRNVVVTN